MSVTLAPVSAMGAGVSLSATDGEKLVTGPGADGAQLPPQTPPRTAPALAGILPGLTQSIRSATGAVLQPVKNTNRKADMRFIRAL
ncbi:MAG: hypothetical protein K2R98_10235 [Gemmataceae bacterium]|nr:hypothetical protein [Gemmataceae bacterium]